VKRTVPAPLSPPEIHFSTHFDNADGSSNVGIPEAKGGLMTASRFSSVDNNGGGSPAFQVIILVSFSFFAVCAVLYEENCVVFFVCEDLPIYMCAVYL
jgi:hypothetical protein